MIKTRALIIGAAVMCGAFSQVLLNGGCSDKNSASATQAGATDKSFDRTASTLEYKLLQAELHLAQAKTPYLILDFSRNQVQIKLNGAVVWNYPMNFDSTDSGEVADFVRRFLGSKQSVMRPLADKYLFEAVGQTPDSVLAIIGKVVRVDPEFLQREIPERFHLEWGSGLIMEVYTSDTLGHPTSVIKNSMVEIRKFLTKPLGQTVLILNVEPGEALTLYRAVNRGMPTLIYSPSAAKKT